MIQNRKRLIIIGWREDINFNYPEFEIEENEYTSKDLFRDLPPLKPGEGSRWNEYTEPANLYLQTSGIRNQNDILTLHIARPHNEKDLNIYKLAISKYEEGVFFKE